MSNSAQGIARVLCATDLSEFGNRALPVAFAAASPSGRVSVLHVLEIKPVPSPLVPRYGEPHAGEAELAAREKECAAALDAAARPLARGRAVAYEVRVARAPHVADAILAEAARGDAELICLATHSRSGLVQLVLGSAAEEVLRRAHRPVLLVPPPAAAV
jgi:nucleotide-binding universal stress UspA family protein